jgi:lipid II:glycine glycyltransferase (peptidoglycan interpeptide bridge formation enzyme)
MLMRQHRHGITLHKYYFQDTRLPSLRAYLTPTAYMDSYGASKPWGFSTEYRHTLVTDLTPNESDIFQNFPKDTRNQIRRCEREHLFELNTNTDLQAFMQLYQRFAKARGLSILQIADIQSLTKSDYQIFSADYQGLPLIGHFYLVSPQTQTVSLLLSASSPLKYTDDTLKQAMAHANRCLHWQGIRYFKQQGFQRYDWGGYALNTSDPTLQGINRFKKTFNGQLTPLYNHYSPLYVLIETIRSILKH